MKLDVEIGLGPSHIVSDGDPERTMITVLCSVTCVWCV